MAEFFDYDPVTGVAEYFEYDHLNKTVTINYRQDVEPIIDYCKTLANQSMTDDGIKKDWWQYCIIPPVVDMALMKKGIDIKDPNATKKIIKEINTNYPWLKTTQKHHA